MLLIRCMLALSLCLATSALCADDTVTDEKLSTAALVEQMLSDDLDAAKRASEALGDRYDFAFELDWWCDEETFAVRRQAVEDLTPLIPQLINAVNSKDVDIAQSALWFLGILGPLPEDDVRAIWESVRNRELLNESTDEIESPFFRFIGVICIELHTLRLLLPDHVSAMSLDAPYIRKRLEIDPKPVQDFRLVSHETEWDDESQMNIRDFGTSVAMYQVLLKGAGWGRAEVRGLLELTSNEFPQGIRIWAIMVLANMGTDAIDAAPELEKLLESDDEMIRFAAVSAVLSVRPEDADLDALLAAARLTKDDENELRESFPEYVRYLESERIDAESIDPEWKAELVEITRRQLSFARGSLRHDAVRNLIQLAEHARPALPELLEAMESPDPVLRELAERAIRKIDGE